MEDQPHECILCQESAQVGVFSDERSRIHKVWCRSCERYAIKDACTAKAVKAETVEAHESTDPLWTRSAPSSTKLGSSSRTSPSTREASAYEAGIGEGRGIPVIYT